MKSTPTRGRQNIVQKPGQGNGGKRCEILCKKIVRIKSNLVFLFNFSGICCIFPKHPAFVCVFTCVVFIVMLQKAFISQFVHKKNVLCSPQALLRMVLLVIDAIKADGKPHVLIRKRGLRNGV